MKLPRLRWRKEYGRRIPHKKQIDILRFLFTPHRGIRIANICCGWGFGKTQLCLTALQLKLEQGSNERVLFVEPDKDRLNKLLVNEWIAQVPGYLYEIKSGVREIHWHNGAIGYFSHRDVYGGKTRAAQKALGPNVTGVIIDEAAIEFNMDLILSYLRGLRVESPNLFMMDASTPLVGPYGDWIMNQGGAEVDGAEQRLFVGRTVDNPHLKPTPEEYDAKLRARMSPERARRELDGELVALEGRIWKDVVYHPTEGKGWPYSNRDDSFVFDKNKPWYILADIGSATGAYACVQPVDATFNGRRIHHGKRWVIFADLCPNERGDVEGACLTLYRAFGEKMAGFACGLDAKKRSDTDGKTPAYFVRKQWGDSAIYPYSERDADERVQGNNLADLFCTGDGARRLTIARNFVSLDEESKRGVREMIQQDVWIREDERRPHDYFPKAQKIRVQHIRDALLKGSMLMLPPEWAKDETRR